MGDKDHDNDGDDDDEYVVPLWGRGGSPRGGHGSILKYFQTPYSLIFQYLVSYSIVFQYLVSYSMIFQYLVSYSVIFQYLVSRSLGALWAMTVSIYHSTSGQAIASDFVKWNEGRISQIKEQDILWFPPQNLVHKGRQTEDTVVDRKMDCNPISQMRALPYWWIWSRPDRCVGYYHHPSVYRDLNFPGFW